MSLLNKLDRQFGQYAIPQLTFGIIICQVVACLLTLAPNGALIFNSLYLDSDKVMQGEVWRLLTFLILPPPTHIIFAFFFWQFFYVMGTSLESLWGEFKFNLYVLVGYIATVGVAFLPHAHGYPITNVFLFGSIFLAFAYLYPDFEIYIFFVFPVRVKWLAMFTWIGYAIGLVQGDQMTRMSILASITNFLVFFGSDLLDHFHQTQKTASRKRTRLRITPSIPDYFHRCEVCGITDKTHPKMEFRYCDKCTDGKGYCKDHLNNHDHS